MEEFQELIIGVSLLLVLVVFGVLGSIIWCNSTSYYTATIKEKIVKTDSKSSRYLIFTKEGEVLQNKDQWLKGKFNSSDIYGQLEVGKTYKFNLVGWRFQMFSQYRNIITFEEVKQ